MRTINGIHARLPIDYKGVVQKELHNTELLYVKYKYAYETSESGKCFAK